MRHITVLQTEAVHALNLKQGSVVVDCTFGSGGHAAAIVEAIGKQGTYIGIDADPTAIEAGQRFATQHDNVHLVPGNFRAIKHILNDLGYETVDAILADLGWRMEQFDGTSGEPRGFSFRHDEPLRMTYGDPEDYPFTAYDIVNEWDEQDIANVIYGYGEERQSRRIARAIVAARQKQPIATSGELAAIVEAAMPRRGYQKTHPATRTFQALRIAVNDEFDTLETLLQDGFAALAPHGRMAIISFHSLEDRIVKQTFRTFVHDQTGVLVHKKPIAPSLEEQNINPRARSAKLRVIEKLP